MRIALCLYGFSYGQYSTRQVDFMKGYESYRKELFDKYEVDVFVHSWNDNKENIIKYYKPKKILLLNI